MSTPAITHLDPSSLGTKSYWDTAYERELTNFADTEGTDEGTVWFADADAEERVLAFLDELEDEGELNKGDNDRAEEEEIVADGDKQEGEDKDVEKEDATRAKNQGSRFLDLGTGNGHFLFALREEGWQGELVGVDYSEPSIALANRILETKSSSETETSYGNISFHSFDILSSPSPPPTWLGSGFDVVVDKGTFDAICLSDAVDAQGRRVCEGYKERVLRLVKPGGMFLVTSCNWTKEELREWFEGKEGDAGGFEYERAVRYPSFMFGGKEGQKVASVCFRRI